MNEKLSSREFFWPLLIIGLGLLVCGQSLTNAFCWDDSAYLWDNPKIPYWAGLSQIWFAPGTPADAFLDYPLALATFGLGHKLWGLNPWGYHTLNLTLHVLNALLLLKLIRRIKPEFAGITALLFIIYPVQVGTVAWISELKNLLCLCFFLAFLSFLDYENNRQRKNYLKMLLFFTASLLSKCIGVCFATIPLLYAWHRNGSFSKRAFSITLPLLFLNAIAILLSIQKQNANPEVLTLPHFPENIILAGKAFFFYINQILLPQHFLFFYPKWNIPMILLSNWIHTAGGLFLYAIFYWNRHRWGRGAFELLCFHGISILPALGFIKISFMYGSHMADHFSYLSAPPLLLFACISLHFLFSKAKSYLFAKSIHPSPLLKKSLITTGVIYLAVTSFRLTKNYKDTMTLFSNLLLQTPRSLFAFFFTGTELTGSNPKNAVLFLQKAIHYKPDFQYAFENLGETEKAVQARQEGLRLIPKSDAARKNQEMAQTAF